MISVAEECDDHQHKALEVVGVHGGEKGGQGAPRQAVEEGGEHQKGRCAPEVTTVEMSLASRQHFSPHQLLRSPRSGLTRATAL